MIDGFHSSDWHFLDEDEEVGGGLYGEEHLPVLMMGLAVEDGFEFVGYLVLDED